MQWISNFPNRRDCWTADWVFWSSDRDNNDMNIFRLHGHFLFDFSILSYISIAHSLLIAPCLMNLKTHFPCFFVRRAAISQSTNAIHTQHNTDKIRLFFVQRLQLMAKTMVDTCDERRSKQTKKNLSIWYQWQNSHYITIVLYVCRYRIASINYGPKGINE